MQQLSALWVIGTEQEPRARRGFSRDSNVQMPNSNQYRTANLGLNPSASDGSNLMGNAKPAGNVAY